MQEESQPKTNRVLIAAGGTGGHIFPALVVARSLRERGFEPYWLGSSSGMEFDLVHNEFPFLFISVRSMRGKSLFLKVLSFIFLLKGICQAYSIIKKLKPKLVVGMGGFVSGPSGLAAYFCRIPFIIHEQNAVAGFTNRCLARWTDWVLQGFSNAFPRSVNAKTVGNPLPPILYTAKLPSIRLKHRRGPLRVLVIGGSLGARAINQCVTTAFRAYQERGKLQIWHQTGQRHFLEVKESYRGMKLSIRIDAFISDMFEAYCWADLVIARAGALTVSEIAAVGVASILVPFPHAVDDHQYLNACYLGKAGAAVVVRQNQLTVDYLLSMLQGYEQDRLSLVKMAEQARQLATPDALSSLLHCCQKLVGSSL